MRFTFLILSIVSLLPGIAGGQAAPKDLDAAVRSLAEENWGTARKIWEWAEPGYQEKRSAGLLAETLEKAGFQVERGVAKIPTAFVATVGKGTPVIGIMGEYDALPGLSQEAVPFRKIRVGNHYGHGCGHHLFGVASLSAALAVGERIQAGKMAGTLKFFGCPAEEGGAARVFMVREGVFDGCDVMLHWHPSSTNLAGGRSNLSRIAAKFRFHGASAHAAGSPEKGRSALDAVELCNHAAQLLREHVPETTRIHHVITDGGGGAPNVVPEFAEVYYYVRHPQSQTVRKLYQRLLKCAQGAALATETKLEVVYLGGTVELLPNDVVSGLAGKHLRNLCDLRYDEEEKKFALRLQETLVDRLPLESVGEVREVTRDSKGSTDVSDVSWVVPTGGFAASCWVPGTPAHSWQAVACGGTTIGKKGMILGARVLAATAQDLFLHPKLIEAAQAEHRTRREGRPYRNLLEPGQPPPLNYRDPPRRTPQ